MKSIILLALLMSANVFATSNCKVGVLSFDSIDYDLNSEAFAKSLALVQGKISQANKLNQTEPFLDARSPAFTTYAGGFLSGMKKVESLILESDLWDRSSDSLKIHLSGLDSHRIVFSVKPRFTPGVQTREILRGDVSAPKHFSVIGNLKEHYTNGKLSKDVLGVAWFNCQ